MNNLSEYKDIWILAEQKEGKLLSISFELITRGIGLARKRNSKLVAIIFSDGINDDELRKLILCGCDLVLSVESPELKNFLPEPYSMAMLELIQKYKPEVILAGATSTGRTLMPYVAMKAYCGLTADCTQLDIEEITGNLLQTRPAIGGNIMACIKTPKNRPQMATIRPHSTKAAIPDQSKKSGEIIKIHPSELLKSRIQYIGFLPLNEKQNIQNAEKVVVVGRGIKKAENIAIARELAESIGAALGATRDVVDRGWLSYPHQIGLSGKTITPKLYIGLGVSGSIQHLAGMQTAETIIAVNNDPEAQIFKVADFGIVGDLFEVVPEMIKQLKEAKSNEKNFCWS
ncbi:MAG TPA: electron transfer flavoprotein subunit alpha/FixB family protein [Victivallales bacterium]|nr:electron transfer flavoprotein subunit alpha/FixB family protein [Victivallales bacterium]HPO91630.1 electron transfer flavoprotein subunit alpha/FixB family protein [Victivallales bacterium]HRR28769.1 electron transfer flavoprotein subunit alpha/FixB family protein [Victivallales bacterium]HRU01482.1 electron transfer flavoprotein subunit alpha/FixB family protein [Victivallales bacterium]